MFSPHHVEALLHERQRELLESAAQARAGGRPRRGDVRPPARLSAWLARLARLVPARRREPQPRPSPAVTTR